MVEAVVPGDGHDAPPTVPVHGRVAGAGEDGAVHPAAQGHATAVDPHLPALGRDLPQADGRLLGVQQRAALEHLGSEDVDLGVELAPGLGVAGGRGLEHKAALPRGQVCLPRRPGQLRPAQPQLDRPRPAVVDDGDGGRDDALRLPPGLDVQDAHRPPGFEVERPQKAVPVGVGVVGVLAAAQPGLGEVGLGGQIVVHRHDEVVPAGRQGLREVMPLGHEGVRGGRAQSAVDIHPGVLGALQVELDMLSGPGVRDVHLAAIVGHARKGPHPGEVQRVTLGQARRALVRRLGGGGQVDVLRPGKRQAVLPHLGIGVVLGRHGLLGLEPLVGVVAARVGRLRRRRVVRPQRKAPKAS